MQQKVFRIEKTFAERRIAQSGHERARPDDIKSMRAPAPAADRSDESFKAELMRMSETLSLTRRDLYKLAGDGHDHPLKRATSELNAAIDGMEGATDKILRSAESADDGARALAASLKSDYERGIAQEIQDQIVHIFEACNFQDLTGQRIGKAIATLASIERQVDLMIERCNGGGGAPAAAHRQPASRGLLNGPKLEGDSGHASQRDIDRMFS